MHLKKKFLQSQAAKTNYSVVLITLVVVVAGFVMFGDEISSAIGNFDLPFSIGDSGGDTDGTTKRLQFSWTDKYSGVAETSKTFYIYDGVTHALLESLTTDSDGVQETAKSYKSGRLLDIKYVDGNSIVWYSIAVPAMGTSDIQGNTYNNIDLEGFTIGTYTNDILMSAGTSYGDSSTFNVTEVGNTNPIFTYQLSNSGADNTGLMNSIDPVYGQNLKVCVVATFSGTGYERVIPQGFDDKFTLGTTTYAVKYYDPMALTKWKIGSTYQAGYTGSDIKSFSLNVNALTDGDSVTMQLRAYAYADPIFAKLNGGDFGETYVEIAEQTVTLISI